MKSSKNFIFPIATIMVGVACIVFAIIAFSQFVYAYDGTEYVRDLAYGGDAYTGMQNASAATARNISDLASMVSGLAFDFAFMFDCFGFIMLIAGCLIILSGTQNLVNAISSKKDKLNIVANEAVKETAEETTFDGIKI